jgi:hypothetical protein
METERLSANAKPSQSPVQCHYCGRGRTHHYPVDRDPPTPDPKPRRLCLAAPPVASIHHHLTSPHSPDQRRHAALHLARRYHERHVFARRPRRHHRKPAELGGASPLTDPCAARPWVRDHPRARGDCNPNVS